jgi:hypothetical protein
MLNTHETNARMAGSELYPASWITSGGSVKGSKCVRVKQVISTVSVSKWTLMLVTAGTELEVGGAKVFGLCDGESPMRLNAGAVNIFLRYYVPGVPLLTKNGIIMDATKQGK